MGSIYFIEGALDHVGGHSEFADENLPDNSLFVNEQNRGHALHRIHAADFRFGVNDERDVDVEHFEKLLSGLFSVVGIVEAHGKKLHVLRFGVCLKGSTKKLKSQEEIG